jgi:flagellar basal-body rod protein FlgC
MKTDMLFSAINTSSTGLSAQRKRMNAVAENIANADTTRSKNGLPYQRQFVTFHSAQSNAFSSALPPVQQSIMPLASTSDGIAIGAGTMQTDVFAQNVADVRGEVHLDTAPFKMVHDPTHPDADEEGYVKMPNVNVVTEMVEMIAASRGYEANVTAINASKQMAKDALDI